MTTTTLQPSGQPKIVAVSVSGAGTLNGATSDALDSSYIFGTADLSYCRLSFPTFTLGANRVKQARLRVRAASTANGDLQTTQVRLRDPVSGATIAPFVCQKGFTTITVQAGGYETDYPGNIEWTQVRLDRLEMEAWWYASPAGQFQRVYELYVDIDTNSVPTVSGVTVTGAATTTRPTVTWSFSDADGDVQTRWWVKIFSAAQYGAAGFNPETSKSTTGTGSRFGDDETWTLTKDLANGGVYKAYVKVAQDWDGPEGDLWWSDWALSSAFTIAVTPPPTPSLTVTGEPTLPGYRNRITVALTGLNLLDYASASFEGASLGGWVAGANTNTPTVSATNPKSGLNNMLLTATGAGSIEGLSGSFATAERVEPGSVVSATASLRALVTTVNWQTGIRFFDVTGATISTPMGSAVSVTSGGYTTPVLANQTVPANAYSAVVRVLSAAGAGGAQYRVDEAGLLIGSSATWTQGGYATGTVLVERSQRVSPNIGRGPARNWVHPQVYSAGALTTATDGYYPRQAGDSVLAKPLDRAAPESPVTSTGGMIEWQIRVGSFSYLDIGAPDAVPTDGEHPYMFPAVPGLSFTGSAWLWASAAITVRLALIFTDAFNTVLATTLTSNTALSTTAQKLTVAATAPAGTVYARFAVEDTLAATGISVFVTQPKFRLTSELDEAWPGTTWAFTWEQVRNTPYPLPANGEDTVSFYDHEVVPGRPLMYRAQIIAAIPDGTAVSSPTSVPVHTYMAPPARNLLSDPFQPENTMIVTIAPNWSETQSTDATIYHPLGRSTDALGTADPIQIRDWLGGQDGDYTISVLSELELYRLRNLIGSNRPLLIQFSEGGAKYMLVAEDRGTQRSAPNLFRIGVKTLQCARPV